MKPHNVKASKHRGAWGLGLGAWGLGVVASVRRWHTVLASSPKTQVTSLDTFRRLDVCLRRGFNLVEMLIALAITAALLSAVMVALRASFVAYQTTTEVASTHTISRLIMSRMLTMIRTGREFGPYPLDPLQNLITSDFIQFTTPDGQVITLEWKEQPDEVNGFPVGEALYVTVEDGVNPPATNLLLEGVKAQYDNSSPPERIKPFTLFYEKGRVLYRATIDLTVVPDDNMSVELDGENTEVLRLVASAMPRMETRE